MRNKNTVQQVTNHIIEQMTPIIDNPSLITDMANYRCMVDIRNELVRRDIHELVAESIVAVMTIELPTTFHKDYPSEYEQLTLTMSSSIVAMYNTIKHDFSDPSAAMIAMAESLSLELDY